MRKDSGNRVETKEKAPIMLSTPPPPLTEDQFISDIKKRASKEVKSKKAVLEYYIDAYLKERLLPEETDYREDYYMMCCTVAAYMLNRSNTTISGDELKALFPESQSNYLSSLLAKISSVSGSDQWPAPFLYDPKKQVYHFKNNLVMHFFGTFNYFSNTGVASTTDEKYKVRRSLQDAMQVPEKKLSEGRIYKGFWAPETVHDRNTRKVQSLAKGYLLPETYRASCNASLLTDGMIESLSYTKEICNIISQSSTQIEKENAKCFIIWKAERSPALKENLLLASKEGNELATEITARLPQGLSHIQSNLSL